MHAPAPTCQGPHWVSVAEEVEEGWSDYTAGLCDFGPLVTSLCLSFLNCEVEIQQLLIIGLL